MTSQLDSPSAPEEIIRLVENFKRQRETYKRGNYNETQVRRDFIDPFFKALGWDIDNREGFAENYRDVIHEDQVKVQGQTKAPDYSFRIGGVRKFFVEAKKPSVKIKEEIDPALQLRRYGWSGKLPLSILTDFEELAIYDTTIKPKTNDKSHVARLQYYTVEDYPTKWGEIAAIFSKTAILQGSFDKYAREAVGKGKETVDNEFLNDIEKLRKDLAENLVKNNDLKLRELNFAVQKIIDRIIFLRICEDRNIENQNRLKDLTGQAGVYRELVRIFHLADEKYNSGLFHFSKERGREANFDELTPKLHIEDATLKRVINSLYYPCPYEFSVMPADILGQVYERFLGNTITITASGHRIKIDEKPEVKKAGGVFYTPSYIVDYIVHHTVGEAVKDKTPEQVAKLKVLDPACGSGSFLIVAYQFLLDWHLNYYLNHPDKKNPVVQLGEHRYKLTTQAKKQILLNNIYGVDIDFQAVEVTKLSLLLKVLEGESREQLENQPAIFSGERVLPDLHRNIKCGNSLIGPEFYQQLTMGELSEDDNSRINVFDWKNGEQGFGEIMNQGGFDCVIGNPPYIQIQKMQEFQSGFEAMNYQTYTKTGDIYGLFYEKGIQLLKAGGALGYITSNKWMRAAYGEKLRDFFSQNNPIQLVDLGGKIFKTATVDTNILIIQKSGNQQNLQAKIVNSQIELEEQGNFVTLRNLSQQSWTIANEAERAIQAKIEKYGTPLKDWDIQIYRGVLTGYNQAFIIDQAKKEELIAQDPKSAEVIKPILRGKDIKRYKSEFANLYLIATLPSLKLDINEYPAIKEYLKSFGKRLHQTGQQGTRKKTNNKWFETQDQIGYWQEFEKEKIIYQEIVQAPSFTHYNEGYMFCLDTGRIITGNHLKFILSILNTKLFFYAVKKFYGGGNLGNSGVRMKHTFFEKFGIPKLSEKEQQPFIDLVNQMLKLQQQADEASDSYSKENLERQISYTDKQIDTLVYQLYHLTDEEIRVIEG